MPKKKDRKFFDDRGNFVSAEVGEIPWSTDRYDQQATGDDRGATERMRGAWGPRDRHDSNRGLSRDDEEPRIGQRLFGHGDTREVIGPDDRIPIRRNDQPPFSGVCQLIMTKNGKRSVGTGCLVRSDFVLTVGHNLFNNPVLSPGWVDSVEVVPGRQGNATPFGSESAMTDQLVVAEDWKSSGDVAFDYGGIALSNGFRGATTFKLKAWTSNEISRMFVSVVGYPASFDSGFAMMGADGRVPGDGIFTHTIRYEVDTSPGNSGSPVIVVDNDDTAYCVAVHSGPAGTRNRATRVSSAVAASIQEWMDA